MRCQAFEKDRLTKFREFLGATEKCLDLSQRLQFVSNANQTISILCFQFRSPIFQQFSQTIKNSDPDKDLSWWSDTYGAGMKMNWPIFEVIFSRRSLSLFLLIGAFSFIDSLPLDELLSLFFCYNGVTLTTP